MKDLVWEQRTTRIRLSWNNQIWAHNRKRTWTEMSGLFRRSKIPVLKNHQPYAPQHLKSTEICLLCLSMFARGIDWKTREVSPVCSEFLSVPSKEDQSLSCPFSQKHSALSREGRPHPSHPGFPGKEKGWWKQTAVSHWASKTSAKPSKWWDTLTTLQRKVPLVWEWRIFFSFTCNDSNVVGCCTKMRRHKRGRILTVLMYATYGISYWRKWL